MQTLPPLFFPNAAVWSPQWTECVSNWIAKSGVLSESQVSVRIRAQHCLISRLVIILVLSSSSLFSRERTLASSRLGCGGRVALTFSLACSPPLLPRFCFGSSVRRLCRSPEAGAARPCWLVLVECKKVEV
ncbi:hypothetical protein AOLI_G00184190 [Acnodon oligacanthus]